MEIIRLAREEDYKFILEISKLTWNGEDYLHKAFNSWLKDGNFYVLEIDGNVVGTVKLSILPDRVGWLEGLRVHPAYRGKGYGKKLHRYIVNIGVKLCEEGKIDTIEFATHLLNKESRKMAEDDGFKSVKRFYFSYREPLEPLKFEKSKIRMEDIWTEDYIPYGWKFLHKTQDSINWLNENAGIGRIENYKFIYSLQDTEPSFFPLDVSREGLAKIIRAMSYYAISQGKKSIGVMIPQGSEDVLSFLIEQGFESMVDFKVPDVLIYRLK